ncbi:oligosaccharide flippase family protein [Candidatus Kaiserbacteria bacterium]|nr:oligosaccharide flippase family protein [Candidatus Kaiserbacteria bacterium]
MQAVKNTLVKILRASERYTHLDMVYVAHGSFWVLFGQVASNLLSLVLVIAFANLLPKETYGLYQYILSLAGILNIFTLTGMNTAVARAVAAGEEGAFRTSVSYQLKWNLLQFLAFLGLGAYYFYNGNTAIALSFLIFSLASPLSQAFNTYSAYLYGKKEIRLSNILGVLTTAAYVLGMLAVILIGGEIIWMVAAYALITLMANLAFYIYTLRAFAPSRGTDARETLRYGRELTFISILDPIVSQIDKIILTHYWGSAQLAMYSLATAAPSRATTLIKSWVGLALPKFAAKSPAELNSVFYTRIFQGLLLGALCTAGYFVLAPYLFTFLLPKYLDALQYSQILSISFIVAIPNRYISQLLASQKLSKVIFSNNLVQVTIRIASYVGFGIWGGLMGLVLAQVLNSFIGLAANIIVWRSWSSRIN